MIDELPDALPDTDHQVAYGPPLTQGEFDALVAELHELRAQRRSELESRLREARYHGSPGDDDDVLSVVEEVSIYEARIARLEDLMRSAPIVQLADDGSASLGCSVEVTDDMGRTTEYRLVGRRTDDADRHDVSPGSPVGRALIGSAAGDTVRVELFVPLGRRSVARSTSAGALRSPSGDWPRRSSRSATGRIRVAVAGVATRRADCRSHGAPRAAHSRPEGDRRRRRNAGVARAPPGSVIVTAARRHGSAIREG